MDCFFGNTKMMFDPSKKKQTPCFSTTSHVGSSVPRVCGERDTKDKEGVPIHSCQVGGVG